MRIAIDLQGAQGENRQRGIGKYSLNIALGLARLRGAHEVYVVLNGGLPESIGAIREAFEGLLPQDHILVWNAPMPVEGADPINLKRRYEAELLREAFLAALNPDWVFVVSHFEGQGGNAVTGVGSWQRLRTAVVLYDLIPWIHSDHYLAEPQTKSWYYSKIDSLKRADLLLSISASTRTEAIEHLGFDAADVVNISAAVDPHFTPKCPTSQDMERLAEVYNLTRPFAMYTGGADHRKNIEGLIKSYAMLPPAIQAAHQLAIVCHVNDDWRHRLSTLIESLGLEKQQVVLTGYVSDSDLHLLYNACHLFVFPSWHEGFGLPVLEAMQCGKPVIAAKLTSLPEAVGRDDALFDPFDLSDMAAKLERGLTDDPFRRSLAEHGLRHSQNFSWDATAQRAWQALEQARQVVLVPERRKRLAFVSPLPPERSGIADYSASLLMELTRCYEIDVCVVNPNEMSDVYVRATCGILSIDEFRDSADRYDRVLYHFGNSVSHAHMFDLLSEIPGVVVLHDFYLSAIQMWSEVHNLRFAAMARALFAERGYHAIAEMFGQTKKKFDFDDYPASLPVIQDSLGVIVHSQFSCRLAEEWYGEACRQKFTIVPFLHRIGVERSTARAEARKQLGLSEDAFVICSFGYVTEAKLVARLIDAWVASDLAERVDAHCVFVGDAPGDYGDRMKEFLAKTSRAARIKITGWVDKSEYRLWLNAADVAVQLRKNSRGETSASIYDSLGKGLPTIVNAHGFAAELDPKAVWMLPDQFSDDELIEALETLADVPARRNELGTYARELITSTQNSRRCAELYFNAIESAYARAERDFLGFAAKIDKNGGALSPEFISALARNNPLQPRQRLLLVDISSVKSQEAGDRSSSKRDSLIHLLMNPPQGFNVEPVYADDAGNYMFARQFTLRLLGCPEGVAFDEIVTACSGDVYLSLGDASSTADPQVRFIEHLRLMGVPLIFLPFDGANEPFPGVKRGNRDAALAYLLQTGFSQMTAEKLYDRIAACCSDAGQFALGLLPIGTKLPEAKEHSEAHTFLTPLVKPLVEEVCIAPVDANVEREAHHEIVSDDANLFHICIQDDMQLPSSFSEMIVRNVTSLKDVYPGYRHTIYSGEALREFIRTHYDSEVVQAFDTLRPYAYKADLGRYCLLHTFGGVYSDLSNRFLRPIPLGGDKTLAAFADTNGGLGAPWSVNNGIIAARKNSAEMELLIKKIVEHIKTRLYGRSPLSPTGPDLLGRVLAECNNPLNYVIGDMACITRTFSQNITFVFLEPSGTLVAARMKSEGGDSRGLGIDFNNNYNDIWNSRGVYGE
ncbi:MAG: glycosyltransferase [Pseudomonadota bacterium]